MSTERFSGFCGPSYQTLSPAESVDRSLNYYFEAVEVPHNPKTDAVLYQRPGSKAFGILPATITGQVRGMLEFDGNGVLDGAIFGVTGSTFWQMNPDGSQLTVGTVANDGKPVYIAANAATVGNIFVASAGHGYCLNCNSGVFSEIPNDGVNFFGARDVAFIDGYFVVLSDTTDNQQFQISALNDGTTWSGIDIAVLLGQADPIQRVLTNIEYLYFIGARRGEIWYNSGNALFPFVIESGAFLESGTDAPGSACQSSNGQSTTIYWLGQDARGGNVAIRASGLTTERISDHAVEAAWSNKDPKKFNGQVYPTTSDCICYPFTWNGHSMVRFIFATAQTGWDFDVTESLRVGFKVWNPVSFTNADGTQTAPFERAHAYAFGLHLIGSGGADGNPGAIYQMDTGTYYDAVTFTITRDRIVRLPFNNGYRVILDQLEILAQAGVGVPAADITFSAGASIGSPSYFVSDTTGLVLGQIVTGIPVPPGATITAIAPDNSIVLSNDGTMTGTFPLTARDPTPGANPVIALRISRDGGQSWEEEIFLPLGPEGATRVRAIVQRLGYYQDGAIWLRITDAVFVCLTGASHALRMLAS